MVASKNNVLYWAGWDGGVKVIFYPPGWLKNQGVGGLDGVLGDQNMDLQGELRQLEKRTALSHIKFL